MKGLWSSVRAPAAQEAPAGRPADTTMTTGRSTLLLLGWLTLAATAFVCLTQSLASAQSPATTGQLAVQVTLQAGPGAAARTWRFEVVNSAGAVAQTLSLGTSGDAPTSSEATSALPYGVYTVRQILGSDTKLVCDATSFYEVTAPAGAQIVVDLGAPRITVPFTIRPCAALPTKLQVQAPIDTVAPLPSPTPPPTPPTLDEVRGSRSEGPPSPLAPSTGDSAGSSPSSASANAVSLLLVLFGVTATFIPSAGFAIAHARRRSKR